MREKIKYVGLGVLITAALMIAMAKRSYRCEHA